MHYALAWLTPKPHPPRVLPCTPSLVVLGHSVRCICRICNCVADLKHAAPSHTTAIKSAWQHAEFDRCWSNGTTTNILRRSVEKWPIASHLSRSLKVIGIDRDRSGTYDFLLTFNSNIGSILYRFQDVARHWPKKLGTFHKVKGKVCHTSMVLLEFRRGAHLPS